ncbi:glutathione peroxidase gpx1 [Phytophthora boehmeriae]|uniref:Glutathione peroxidase gpx1 n=1 Tax=Phytophthora boehmeriae TaxID=109152 RepID=A0A8T1W825_9STRA|nr:glutathione peroxidase gpx1 [Phytophthora boehmeriae]
MVYSVVRRRLPRSTLLATRLQSLTASSHAPQRRTFASFSPLLRFATIQPPNGQLTPEDFRFKALLVVNTASKCSHALQLKALQSLHEKYSERGLIVLAVPSNDFAGQEPGSADEIREKYTSESFGVTFPIAEKAVVTGDQAHPFFKRIADKYSASVAPTWNFDKFLVDHRGDIRAVFPNDTDPLLPEVLAEIEEVLEELPRALSADQELLDEDEYDFEYDEEDSDDEEDEEEEDEDDDDRRNK